MILEKERHVDHVFETCCDLCRTAGSFTAEGVIAAIVQSPENGEAGYWQQKNITTALSALERARLIAGKIQPEYTTNLRLLKEVKHGKVTWLGRLFCKLPFWVRVVIFKLFLVRESLTALVGVFALVSLLRNAYLGASLLGGWLDYVAATIVLFVLYHFLKGRLE